MIYFWIVLVLVQLLSIRECDAFPSGAPTSTCTSLTPGHGVQLTGVNPFVLVVQQQPNRRLSVTLTSTSGNSPLQGFILQAREAGGSAPLGSFGNLPAGTQAIRCTQNMDTTTHTDTTSKTNLTFLWTPETEATNMRFYATVAVDKQNYWKGIQSDEVNLPLSAGTPSSSIITTSSKASISAPSVFMLLVGHFVLTLSVLFLN